MRLLTDSTSQAAGTYSWPSRASRGAIPRRSPGDVGGDRYYGPFMRLILVLTIMVIATGASTSSAGTRKPCVVPRLYTLSISSATALIRSSGCTLGGVSYQRPRRGVAVVTNQVPAPGAIVPPSSRVFLIAA